jgi:hypothetical protein
LKRAIAKPRPALDAICDALVEFPIKRFSEPARDLPGQVMVSRRLILEWCKCAGLLPADEKLPEGVRRWPPQGRAERFGLLSADCR